MECGDNFLTPGEQSAASLLEVDISTDEISGIDFLYISDTNTHASLNCYMIAVTTDTVFNEILVSGANVVTAKGLSGKTIAAGTLLPFGKVHATSIDLTSGTVVAYIY